ncbi:helix-turn-helix transcriptional regulator [Novipirellula caenicola]|uniref:HTH cro/C1-type domain-containing protein n=1 Tax=Novipirellula caenicola TaxID=1536901 RepID=A0ABP9W060_9BACT
MTFGQRVRELRKIQGFTLRELAPEAGVSYTYLSKVENERLDFGEYPSEALIRRLASALKADEEELMLLADKVPASIRKRLRERPDAFRRLAELNDQTLDQLIASL